MLQPVVRIIAVLTLLLALCAAPVNAGTTDLDLTVTGAVDGKLTVSEPTADLRGSAGVRTTITGSCITAIDLSSSQIAEDCNIAITVTQAAAKAYMTGTADLNTDLRGQSICINGVMVALSDGLNSPVQDVLDINAVTDQTGVTARLDGGNHLVLMQTKYGAAERIDITHGTAIFGSDNASCAGVNAYAQVASGGIDLTDALWTSGDGLVLQDSLGNKIALTETCGTMVGFLGTQANVHVQPVSSVMWNNETTGEGAPCLGTNYWGTGMIRLAVGDNRVVFTATDANGDTDTKAVTITRLPRYATVRITSPSSPAYTVYSPTVDISGVVCPKVTITGSAVVDADLPSVSVSSTTNVSITTTQSATKASLLGTADITGDMSCAMITINGVTIMGGPDAAATISAINAHTSETGIVASLCAWFLRLDQQGYGSNARITVIGGVMMFGSATAAAIGTDVQAIVLRSDGSNLTDVVWSDGTGTVLKDSQGNSIILTDAVASAPPMALGTQLTVEPASAGLITWTNETTGDSGKCDGTSVWWAKEIPLVAGVNKIKVCPDSGTCDEIEVTRGASSLGDAKSTNDGELISVPACVVIAGTPDIGDGFYIESLDRSCGIKVTGKTAYKGNKVCVAGKLTTVTGEREIQATSLTWYLGPGEVNPLGTPLSAIGKGLGNTGMLVRVWGNIIERDSSTNPTWFKVSDGSKLAIKCIVPDGVSIDPTWTHVGVNGVSSTEWVDGKSIPVVRVRTQSDINAF